MARPGWYNENSGRDYPFVFARDGNVLRDHPDVIVDFGCVVGIHGDFIEGEHSIWLHSLYKIGNYVDFNFYSNAPGLEHHKLTFTRELTDSGYETEFAEGEVREATSLSVPPADLHAPICDVDVLWEGFLVTKEVTKLSLLFSEFPPEQELLFDAGDLNVEPGLIRNLAGHYMSTLNVFNTNRTRAQRLPGCNPWCWPNNNYTSYDYFQVETCLYGDIRIAEGHNCFIEEDRLNNKLTIHAQNGAGLGEPSGDLQHFPGEEKPQGGSYYDGAIGCEELIRSVNGIEGPHIEIIGGQGVTVDTIPGQHLIVVKVDMQDLIGCFEQEASTSLTEITPDADPCVCGEA